MPRPGGPRVAESLWIDALVALQPLPDIMFAASAAPMLFFRTNDSHSVWTPAGTATVERLIRTRTPNDPWVTFCRPFHAANDPNDFHAYFQVLGTGPDALLVEGGGLDERGLWNWTSTWHPRQTDQVTVGPHWYQYSVDASEVQTASDALTQLCPALADGDGNMIAPTGYEWRWRDARP